MRIVCCCLFAYLTMHSVIVNAGTIRGKVSDTKNSPLIGATISIEKTKLGAKANKNGEFAIMNVPAGIYTLKTHCVGYREAEVLNVRITGDSDIQTVNFELPIEAVKGAEIVVQARASEESEASARLSEKNAGNIINVVTAETIQRSPDRTSADVLKRVSGLSLQKDQGEGRYVIFRGMDQRYNNTTLNGIKIPSPEPKVRFVPLDIVPSELLERIEVTKALTPDLEADAIGGTANLVFRNAPEDMLLIASAASGYSSYLLGNKYITFDKNAIQTDPAQRLGSSSVAQPGDFTRNNLKFNPTQATPDAFASLTFADRLLDNSLGFVASGTFQNTFRRTEGLLYSLKYDINNVDTVSHIILPSYAEQNNRSYSTNRTRAGLYGKADYILTADNIFDVSYSYVQLDETEVRHTLNSVVGPGRGRAAFFIQDRSHFQSQKISTAQLEGNHTLVPELSLKWSASYSDASRDQPDKAEIFLDQNKDANGNVDSTIAFHNVTRSWQNNDDKDLEGKLDLEYKPASDLSVKFGGLYRKKDRVNYQNDYNLNPDTAGGVGSQRWTGIDHASWTVYDNLGTSVFGFNNYTANETVTAGYLEGIYILGKIQLLGGIRMEITQQGYTTQAPQNLFGTAASISYTDLLPSLHLKYSLSPEQNLRFSVTQSISRPSYFELVPYQIQGDQYTEKGNYQLRRTKATNLDIRYEFYPTVLELLTVGVFYKNIVDPIELSFDDQNPASAVIMPKNLGTAVNYGFEVVASRRFGELGVSANYTFTHSALTSDKIRFLRVGANDPTVEHIQQTRPLVGQSGNILNASVLFDHTESGSFIELSYGLTGRRLIYVSPFDGFDNYQNPLSELDLSLEQKIGEKFVAFGKFTNLLNAPYEVVLPNGQLIQQEYYKPSAQIGMRYKF